MHVYEVRTHARLVEKSSRMTHFFQVEVLILPNGTYHVSSSVSIDGEKKRKDQQNTTNNIRSTHQAHRIIITEEAFL